MHVLPLLSQLCHNRLEHHTRQALLLPPSHIPFLYANIYQIHQRCPDPYLPSLQHESSLCVQRRQDAEIGGEEALKGLVSIYGLEVRLRAEVVRMWRGGIYEANG